MNDRLLKAGQVDLFAMVFITEWVHQHPSDRLKVASL
jgi:hypothetical protein